MIMNIALGKLKHFINELQVKKCLRPKENIIEERMNMETVEFVEKYN